MAIVVHFYRIIFARAILTLLMRHVSLYTHLCSCVTCEKLSVRWFLQNACSKLVESVFSNEKFQACDTRYGIERMFFKYVGLKLSTLKSCHSACSLIINMAKLCNDREYTIGPSDLPQECGKFLTFSFLLVLFR